MQYPDKGISWPLFNLIFAYVIERKEIQQRGQNEDCGLWKSRRRRRGKEREMRKVKKENLTQ